MAPFDVFRSAPLAEHTHKDTSAPAQRQRDSFAGKILIERCVIREYPCCKKIIKKGIRVSLAKRIWDPATARM
jgi:hypothetical protein